VGSVGFLLWALLAFVAACSSAPGPLADGGPPPDPLDGGAAEDGGGAEDGGVQPPPPLATTPVQRLYIEPRDGNTFLTSALSGARSSVDAVFYILTDDAVENGLVAAKRRGVNVRVILEPDQAANDSARARLQDGGVPVSGGPPGFTNYHQKSLVVDGTQAFIMTLNPSAAAFHDNREYAALVTRQAEIDDLRGIFNADWTSGVAPQLRGNLLVSPINARARLRDFLGRAQRDILLTVEVFTDDEIRSVLKGRLDAGVTVRILLADPRDVSQNADAAVVLKSLGFQVRFIHNPVLHAKLIVVDGASAYAGSVNLTPTSMDRNREAGLLIDAPTIVGQLRTQAEADWNAGTTP
jgi:phosphatidylserine/phosphatidylglycerophosphate/cardiolipin synthase-like enzyme